MPIRMTAGFLAGAMSVVVASGLILPVSAEAATLAPPTEPVPAPLPYDGAYSAEPGPLPSLPSDAPSALAACVPFARTDNPHTSGGDVSQHGWWTKNTCRGPRAVVTIQLQEYYSDRTWRTKGSLGREHVYPGGGRGQRATSRAACASPVPAAWRSLVTVATDDGGRASAYTVGINVACRTVP